MTCVSSIMTQRIVAVISALLLMISFWVVPAVAIAAEDSQGQVCDALQEVSPGVRGCRSDAGKTGVNDLIRLAMTFLSIIAGVIAVIMIIIGGLKFITSDGDSNQMSSAKKTLIYALVGLVIVVMAQAIVKFVLAKAT